jgi:signal peptidase II
VQGEGGDPKSSGKPVEVQPAELKDAHLPMHFSTRDDSLEKNVQLSHIKYAAIALLAVAADQISKTAVVRSLSVGEWTPVLGDFFKLTLVLNPGGVFGTKLGSPNFYTLISVIAIGATLWFFFKTKTDGAVFKIGLSLILGGAIGNLIDRFRFGEVVDFLDFDFFDINLPGLQLDRWPVFNLADSFVLVGMVLIVIHLFISKENPKELISQSPE